MSLEGKSPEEIQALAALADDVLSKPDTAGVFKRLVKKNNPNVSMPDVELEERAAAAHNKLAKRVEDQDAKLAQADAQQAVNTLYEELRDEGVVSTRASFNELVKWASGNGFMTSKQGLQKAAMQRDIENEPAEPTPQTVNNGFQLGGQQDDASKAFMKDPIGSARAAAAKAMDELRKDRGKGAKTH